MQKLGIRKISNRGESHVRFTNVFLHKHGFYKRERLVDVDGVGKENTRSINGDIKSLKRHQLYVTSNFANNPEIKKSADGLSSY